MLNPYAAPNASAPPPVSGNLRTEATAVIIGASIGNGLALTSMALATQGYQWLIHLAGVPLEQLFLQTVRSTPLLLLAHMLAILAGIPGGYWAARLGGAHPFRCALGAALLVALIAALMAYGMPYPSPLPAWSPLASVLTPFPGFWIGQLIQSNQGPARRA